MSRYWLGVWPFLRRNRREKDRESSYPTERAILVMVKSEWVSSVQAWRMRTSSK